MNNLDSSINSPGPTLLQLSLLPTVEFIGLECLPLSTGKGEQEVLVLILLFENSLTLSKTLHVSETPPFLRWSNVSNFSASLQCCYKEMKTVTMFCKSKFPTETETPITTQASEIEQALSPTN